MKAVHIFSSKSMTCRHAPVYTNKTCGCDLRNNLHVHLVIQRKICDLEELLATHELKQQSNSAAAPSVTHVHWRACSILIPSIAVALYLPTISFVCSRSNQSDDAPPLPTLATGQDVNSFDSAERRTMLTIYSDK